MEMELTPIFVGFTLGILSYAVTKLYVDPILKFRSVLYQIDSTLFYYANCKFLISEKVISDNNLRENENNKVKEGKKELRKQVGRLRASYHETCFLYKWWLIFFKIDPIKTSTLLLQFSNTLEPTSIDHETKIRKMLKIHRL
ncbi:hypothetical protein [Maridesulfovibrio ferrireducens]|uniref:hypothetical protein n=1 Tax=Maridesulfovibrio ferrireducens TaxID=246191 RepID=UPI001A29ADCF|nr:hypothetical protein [Maridesulfovibrio ferrireducens]MBI9112429.1 hypothetical protein [Maridesulfovibrio ferrireducens]